MNQTVLHLLSWTATLATPLVCAADLATLRQEARAEAYVAPTEDEITQARTLFRRLFEDDGELAPSWAALGFDLCTVKEGGATYRVLMETSARREGRGFFVFPSPARRPLLVQAPHAFYDSHTGPIALELLKSRPAAIAWNIVHRREVDLAHHDPSYFNALLLAFGDIHPEGSILQLHGYSKKKRKTERGRKSDVILSNGTRQPGRELESFAACLRFSLKVAEAVFPRDVDELGAGTNVQARVWRDLGHSSFFHLEMSSELRRRLRREKPSVRFIEQCLP